MVFYCNSIFTICPNGFSPVLAPVQLTSGNFIYAGTFWGGQGNPNAGGTVTLVNTLGIGSAIYTFLPGLGNNFPNGSHPSVALVKGPDGNLYGVTLNGGPSTFGVMFRLTPRGSFQVLHNFCSLQGCPDANAPITTASDGNFYGIASKVFFRISPQGVWTQIAMVPIDTGLGTRLIQANDGNFYGVSMTSNAAFRVTPGGQFTLLHQFQYPLFPTSPLIQATDGNLYGATGGSGVGTGIFRMSLSGDLKFIHSMTDAEGFGPVQLLQATDGNLWGLSNFRDGSYFAITLGGNSLFSGAFSCGVTGCHPSGMIEASDGNLYGISATGGHAAGEYPIGTVFKIAAGLAR
jgi:uncharacterized repeat protein (TIGR03803 family)